MSKKIAIGSDHAGVEYKAALITFLNELGYTVQDFGPATADSVDYPDYAHPLASSVENKENELGILICGSANGVAITANKHQGIRAAICWLEEISALARQHNDANVVCIPARFIDLDLAKRIVRTFLTTDFEGGRHANRVNKISCA
ncbi:MULTISPECIES: ribose 5-phosphate isomerase B [Sphingobacterium]|uniref:Ribose 5-phosphate isomerase B n=1 Tax=Sphingobacterium cellulitidis TaxID=1768011 RepID=A0A8H9FYI3_9SPHI|nr:MULTISPECIES: ribose 5-phosphate isomerase B [Sphingobacterium]MBA8985731.1 ribose 5-phosphate isomerase B [Sphingobacterium soli]OYD43800.1 ribose 5-phosphate isomerase B [Sphingobacterium cellulitidis]OYD47056.1 ribose 5-phosphate isomerase B [Sphingobacterium cellulitidis]WFB64143.1 ribose 5-phosphate isomerase B [Sphingobacterium sp. WM]GGE07380.1 ribose 5-phosphate isomerase B [Sphingobacterium soli]